ncbi:SGNH/GDSL hydrolase family protein [Cellulomonas triticagri]|uniref:SGNH/GDSL hydrolase family protein n=1 Tax=Cellulomonas triticagri TaxID=2483352 RepID=A0A3M2JPM2_9CELL|nr:SGNH/GDSL hydrolase family protein [Cellulomonas triticagri]
MPALALGMGLAGPAPAGASPDVGSGPALQLGIDFPSRGERVSSADVPFRGSVRPAGSTDQSDALVQYVVDVSSSTASPLQDCNGDGVRDVLDDFNGDGRFGDVLDCQISAVVALNASLRATPGADRVRVGLTAFGSTAATAQMTPGDSGEQFVPPGATGDDRDVIPRLNFVASSLRTGFLGEYAEHDVGAGTNFDAALTAALDALGPGPAPRWLFFLSDGQASVSQSTLDRVARSGVGVRTFAVGGGTGAAPCSATAPLGRIAAAGSDTCEQVRDPAALTASLVASQPAWLHSVTVTTAGRTVAAELDPVGGWTATVPGLANGSHRATVAATLVDGTVLTSVVQFSVADGLSYVALGDSYASGEGVAPYLQGPMDDLCHRSDRAWPTLVTLPDSAQPIAARDDAEFRFLACSGARIVNLDTTPQPKSHRTEGEGVNPLQLDGLRPDTSLVTLSIGGNDLGFAPIVMHCFMTLSCPEHGFITTASGTDVSLQDWTTIRLALIGNELTGTYEAIRSRVSPDTTIVTTTYPRLVSGDPQPVNLTPFDFGYFACTPVALSHGERQWLRRQVDTFADIVHDRARRPGAAVRVADVRDDFEGRNACDSDNYILGPVFWRDTDLELAPVSAASFHPTARGARLYATAVDEVLHAAFDHRTSGASATGARTGDLARPATAAASRASAAPRTIANAGSATGSVSAVTPEGELDPVTDPEGVLDQYPEDVVSAVGSTSFADVSLANGAAVDGYPACDHVVAHEVVPLRTMDFGPGSTVTSTTKAIGFDGTEYGTTTAEHLVPEDGRLLTEVVAPAIGGEGVLTVSLSGVGGGGGPVIGTALASTSADPDCVALVHAAGRIAPEADRQGSTPSPTDRPDPDEAGAADLDAAATTPSDADHATSDDLAGTGVGRAALVVGIALALGGAGLAWSRLSNRGRRITAGA